MNWAIHFARQAQDAQEVFAGEFGGMTETQRIQDRIVEYLRSKNLNPIKKTEKDWNDQGWCTANQITRRFRNVPKKLRDEALSTLVEAGMMSRKSMENDADKRRNTVCYRLPKSLQNSRP